MDTKNPDGGAPGQAVVTASSRYSQLEAFRSAVLERARAASKLTIPTLIPPVAATQSTRLPTPWQSVGARGVNNLTAKLLISLFPPNSPFFRLVCEEGVIEKLTQAQPELKTEIEAALSKYERIVQSEIEAQQIRVAAAEALKHLIVGGNALVHLMPTGGMRTFGLPNYVVKRAGDGAVLEIILKECVSVMELPDAARKLAAADNKSRSPEDNVELYTWIRRTKNVWRVHQEIKDGRIPGTEGTYPLDKPAWIALRWSRVDGEDYGRGHVEEYQGDLQSLEGLAKAIVEASAAAAKLLILVKPNGTTKKKDISDAPNGAVREGNMEDVGVVQQNKSADLKVASETSQQIEERLSYAFMLNSAIQRDAERVTAAEIRFMANELDTSMGGLYSLLSQEFQLPLVTRLIFQLERQGKLPPLPKGMVRPTIITGMEALGRGNDLDKLDQFITGIAELLGPGVVQSYINVSEYMARRATALGIDTTGLVKSDAQVQQEQQQQQMMATAHAAVPHVIKGASQIGNTVAKAQLEQGAGAAGGSTAGPQQGS